MSTLGTDPGQLLNLNFLPEGYLRIRERRNIQRRQMKIVFLFFLVVGFCTWFQLDRRHQIIRERDQAVDSLGTLTKNLQSPLALRQELSQLDCKADMLTMLRLRNLPTQIYGILEETRPPEVRLLKLKLSYSKSRESLISMRPVATPPETPGLSVQSERDRLQIDLERIQSLVNNRQQEMRLEGVAPNDLQVAAFLGRLRRHEMCQEVRLEYTDRLESVSSAESRRFSIQVLLRMPFSVIEEGEKGVVMQRSSEVDSARTAISTTLAKHGVSR